MAKFGSIQNKVKKVRSSRVEIVHDVHLPNGTTTQESLALVVGVIADLSGDRVEPRESLRDASRDFVRIHKENFDSVIAGHRPRLTFEVPDTLGGSGMLRLDLHFSGLDDFHPDQVLQKVPELQEQLRTRRLLEEIRNRISSDPALEERLEEIISDPAKRAQFLAEMSRRAAAPNQELRYE